MCKSLNINDNKQHVLLIMTGKDTCPYLRLQLTLLSHKTVLSATINDLHFKHKTGLVLQSTP